MVELRDAHEMPWIDPVRSVVHVRGSMLLDHCIELILCVVATLEPHTVMFNLWLEKVREIVHPPDDSVAGCTNRGPLDLQLVTVGAVCQHGVPASQCGGVGVVESVCAGCITLCST
jgi:hypothetical protein